MKVELHLHTMRYSGCAHATPNQLMVALIQAGYGAVYITEHDAVWSEWELANLQDQFPEILIFPGVEVTLGWDPLQHLLVLGTHDAEFVRMEDDPEAVIARAREQGCLTVACHPFRWQGAGAVLDGEMVPDAIEYRSCNHNAKQGEQSMAKAETLGLPLVNGGDVHSLDFVNCFWIETHRPIAAARDIRSIILEGAYENCMRQGR